MRETQPRPERQRPAAADQQRPPERVNPFLIAVVGTTILAIVAIVAVWWVGFRNSAALAGALTQLQAAGPHTLAFDPTDPNTIYFGHQRGVMVSHDAGKTWQDLPGLDGDAMSIGIPLADPSHRYVAGRGLFLTSTDGGQSWRPPEGETLPDRDIQGFAVAPSDPDRLYAFGARSRAFLISGDGGRTWEARALPPGAGATLPLAVAPDDPDHLYAAVGRKIAESRDGGRTWRTLDGPGAELTALTLAPGDQPTVYLGAVGGLYRGAADGSWSRVTIEAKSPILAVAISPADPRRIVALDAKGYFYRSDDGGETWLGR